RMDVAHVAVQEEQVRRARVVAVEHARGEPGRDADLLHGSSLRRWTPSALPASRRYTLPSVEAPITIAPAAAGDETTGPRVAVSKRGAPVATSSPCRCPS